MADSDTDYRLERLTPERLPDLVALHAATYGPGLTLDDARRKFSTATLGHDVIGYLAYDRAGTAAAYYGIFPMRVRLGDRDLLAGRAIGLGQVPDAQHDGIAGCDAKRMRCLFESPFGIAGVYQGRNGRSRDQSWRRRDRDGRAGRRGR